MKKQILILGVLAIVFSLAIIACGGGETSTEQSTDPAATEQPATETAPATEASPAADTTATQGAGEEK